VRLKYWQPRRGLSALPIRLDPAAQEAGFAPRLTDLIRRNVEQHPERRTGFDRLRGSVAIRATDSEVAATLEFLDGKLLVHDGVQTRPDLVISSDRRTLLELPCTKLCFCFPDATHPSGRAVLRKMCSGKIRVRGRALLLKPLLFPRLIKLLSVAPDQMPRTAG
jgi:hypothetical protein